MLSQFKAFLLSTNQKNRNKHRIQDNKNKKANYRPNEWKTGCLAVLSDIFQENTLVKTLTKLK